LFKQPVYYYYCQVFLRENFSENNFNENFPGLTGSLILSANDDVGRYWEVEISNLRLFNFKMALQLKSFFFSQQWDLEQNLAWSRTLQFQQVGFHYFDFVTNLIPLLLQGHYNWSSFTTFKYFNYKNVLFKMVNFLPKQIFHILGLY